MRRAIFGITLVAMLAASHARGEPTVEKNVGYGMHSGLALLLDVHRPDKPNGYGIVHVSGSAWHAPLGYDARPLKESQIQFWGVLLLHGDSDDVVPDEQSVATEKALRAVDVPVKLVRIPQGEHGEDFGVEGERPATWPDYHAEAVAWFERYLSLSSR